MEKWLLHIQKLFKKDKLLSRVFYEDRFQGSHMGLSAELKSGKIVIELHRKGKGALFILFADKKEAASEFASLINREYRKLSWFKNSGRKFLHRLEKSGKQLQKEFAKIQAEYPDEDLQNLRHLYPEATPLYGMRTGIMVPASSSLEGESPAKRKRLQKAEYLKAAGALVNIDDKEVPLVYILEKEAFSVPFGVSRQLVKTIQSRGENSFTKYALTLQSPPPEKPKKSKPRASNDGGNNFNSGGPYPHRRNNPSLFEEFTGDEDETDREDLLDTGDSGSINDSGGGGDSDGVFSDLGDAVFESLGDASSCDILPDCDIIPDCDCG